MNRKGFDASHENLFFDNQNPFIQKVDDETQKTFCEKKLTYQECLTALTNRKNRRSQV